MSDIRPRARLTMDLDLDAEPVEGVLRHEHGTDKPFAGWVSLIRALELALDDERRHNDQGSKKKDS